jgi:hypothetical protein
VPLPFDLKPGTWHRVRTVTGAALDVYIDDQLVLSVPISGVGSVGFAGYDDTEGLFRNLLVDRCKRPHAPAIFANRSLDLGCLYGWHQQPISDRGRSQARPP